MIFNPSAPEVRARTGSVAACTERRGRVTFYAGKASASARLITLSLGGATPPPATNLHGWKTLRLPKSLTESERKGDLTSAGTRAQLWQMPGSRDRLSWDAKNAGPYFGLSGVDGDTRCATTRAVRIRRDEAEWELLSLADSRKPLGRELVQFQPQTIIPAEKGPDGLLLAKRQWARSRKYSDISLGAGASFGVKGGECRFESCRQSNGVADISATPPTNFRQGAGSARFRSCCALSTQPCRY